MSSMLSQSIMNCIIFEIIYYYFFHCRFRLYVNLIINVACSIIVERGDRIPFLVHTTSELKKHESGHTRASVGPLLIGPYTSWSH